MMVHEDGSTTFTVCEATEENLRDEGQGGTIVSFLIWSHSVILISFPELYAVCHIISTDLFLPQ